jgi:hypothetical protein
MESNAQQVLESSTILVPNNCRIVGGVLFELLFDAEYKYRFFFNADDYDYVVDPPEIAELDVIFQA